MGKRQQNKIEKVYTYMKIESSVWPIATLEDVAEICDNQRKPVNGKERAKRLEGKKREELYPYYGATGQVGYIDEYIIDGEYVLLGEDGAPFLDALAKKAYLISGRSWVNNHAHILRAKINSRFLCYYLNVFSYKDFVSGTTRLKLTQAAMKKIPVPCPSPEEQKNIVKRIKELFSKLDKSVETLKVTKVQLTVYRQAVLKEAFEEIEEKRPIRELALLVTSGSRGWAKYYSDHGARFIRITDLTRDRICLKNDNIQYVDLPYTAEGKRSLLMKNDVLVSITADLGSIALVPNSVGEAYINQHIAMIRFKNTNQGTYMAWYLKSEWGQKDLLRNKRGGGKLGLGLDDIRDTAVPVVSDVVAMNTVARIESRLSVCDRIEQTVDTALQQAEAMRRSILKQAFEGRLL
ncbi:MAG: restriction endonuclease subunit S [Blautia sp.]|nr:restriction endonuclease subunit S [Blautia sp.]